MIAPFPTPQARRRPVETAERVIAPSAFTFAYVAADESQIAARHYYRMGFNVFALERGEKETRFKWGKLHATRLINPDALHPTEPTLYSEMFNLAFRDANIAIVTGRTSLNLSVLDCENERSADRHRKEFERRGLTPWIVRTSRGFHFWFLSQDGTLQNIQPETNNGEWELRANNKYVMAPPSVHPTGAIYEWVEHEGDLPPSIPLAALDWMGAKLLTPERSQFVPRPEDTSPLAKLSKRNRDFCENGAPVGDRNKRLTAAARDFAGNDIDVETARTFLLQGCAQSGYDKSFTRRQCERVIADAYKKPRTAAKSFYGKSRRQSKQPLYRKALVFSQSHAWDMLHAKHNNRAIHVAADTARKVFEACCERARMDDVRDVKKPFRAASREIAELADVDRRTASKTLAALAANDYLIAYGPNETGANRFTFGKKPSAHKCTNSLGLYVRTGTFVRADVYRDVFTRGGLANSAGRVWRLILEKPLTVKQIAKRANMKPPTVRRALVKLESKALARRVGNGYWIGETADAEQLAKIAAQCETLGKTAKRRAKHILERQRDVTERLLFWRFGRMWARQLQAWGQA